MIVDVGEDDSPAEGLAETLIGIEGEEDMVAVGPEEMLIGGADKVVGTSA